LNVLKEFGHVILGGSVSEILTENEQLAELPAASLTW
jgi:hypothetical protein